MSGLSPETRSMLARGRAGHSLSEDRRKGMKRALLVRIAGGAVVASTTSATALAAKVVAVAILVGAVGASVTAVVGSRSAARSPARVTAPVPSIGHAGGEEGSLRGSSPASPSEIASGEVPAAAPAEDGVGAPVGATPSAAMASPVATAPGNAIPRSAVASPRRTPPGDTAAGAPAQPPPPVPSLGAEAHLLMDAHQALQAGDPETALRLLGEHAARFPSSVLEPERSSERVLALCRAGRKVEAQREARAFVARHGTGPLALRVQRSCGGEDD